MLEQTRDFVLLNDAQQALLQAQSVDEIKEVRNRAQAVRAYLRKARMGRKHIVDAAILRIKAERKLGAVLRELPLAKAAPGNQYTRAPGAQSRAGGGGPIYLRELGITESDSSRAQRIASLPERVFEDYLASARQLEKEPSVAGLLRLAKQCARTQKPARERYGERGRPSPKTVNALLSEQQRFATLFVRPNWPRVASRASKALQRVLEQLREEPVDCLAQPKAHLHVLASAFLLPETLQLIEAWGFLYQSCLVFQVSRRGRKSRHGDATTFLLSARRGSLPFRSAFSPETQEVESSRLIHSTLEYIERVSPGPYVGLHVEEISGYTDWTLCR